MIEMQNIKQLILVPQSLIMIVCIILSLYFTNLARAQYIYSDCVTATDFGQRNQDDFIIRPIGEICFSRCQEQCEVFSKRINNVEINQDIIDKCNISCKSGYIYSSKKRISEVNGSTDSYNWSNDTLSTKTYCAQGGSAIDSVGYNTYNTKLRVKPQDKIQIKIMNLGDPNTVFLCGSSTTTINPSFESLRKQDWQNNRKKWDNSSSDSSMWNARNKLYTNTSIDVKDGDYISITYGGQFRSCFNKGCNPISSDTNLWIMRPSFVNGSMNGFNNQFKQGSYIELPANQLQTITVSNDDGNQPTISGDIESVIQNNQGVSAYGLNGSMTLKKTRFAQGLTFNGPNTSKLNNDTIVYSQDPYYTFNGVLDNFSDRFTRLGISYPTTVSTNALGGFTVSITRQGCQYNNGQRLQFAIAKVDPTTDEKNPIFKDIAESDWIDLTDNNLSNFEFLNIPADGLLNLRIKPLVWSDDYTPTCSTINSICMNSIINSKQLYQPQNTFGQYYVQVQRTESESGVDETIISIVDMINKYLFGDDQNQMGMVQNLFNKFVSDSGFMKTIRALIVLYIAFIGMGFMIGIAPFTQKEAVTRLAKVGLVLTLIAPGSWKFFNDHLFKLFTQGMLELLIKVTADPNTPPSVMADLIKHPTKIFTVFTEPFMILYGKVTWIKISALCFSGSPIGFVLAIVILLATVIYGLCLMKAILMYMLSLVGIGVLLIMAPIFICFALFQYTKDMFISWLKQLLSFVFQPVFVFTFVMIINYLVLATLKLALGFSACKSCWFSISIPFYETICIIPGYITTYGLHSSGFNTGIAMATIVAVFHFLILAQAMYMFTNFGARIAFNIVTGMFGGVNLSEGAKFVMTESVSMVTKTVGVDRQSVMGAKKAREKLGATASGVGSVIKTIKKRP